MHETAVCAHFGFNIDKYETEMYSARHERN